MSGDARDFNNIEKQAAINSFSFNTSKYIQLILIEILGEHEPSYATVKK
jgi:hypothetical protein